MIRIFLNSNNIEPFAVQSKFIGSSTVRIPETPEERLRDKSYEHKKTETLEERNICLEKFPDHQNACRKAETPEERNTPEDKTLEKKTPEEGETPNKKTP